MPFTVEMIFPEWSLGVIGHMFTLAVDTFKGVWVWFIWFGL